MTDNNTKVIVKCQKCGQSNSFDLLRVSENYQPVCGRCRSILLRTSIWDKINTYIAVARIKILNKNYTSSGSFHWNNKLINYVNRFAIFSKFIINLVIMVGLPILSGVLLQNNNEHKKILSVLLCLSIGILATSLHEFLHAITAYLAGNDSVKDRGYLELNPINYFHSINSLILPTVCFLYSGIFLPGAAVFIDRSSINVGLWNSLVSLAGVIGDLIILLCITFIISNYGEFLSPEVMYVISFSAYAQILCIIYNLLPVPGFDGWGIIEPFIPNYFVQILEPFKSVAPFLFFYMLMSNSEFSPPFFQYAKSWQDYFNLNEFYVSSGWRLINLLR